MVNLTVPLELVLHLIVVHIVFSQLHIAVILLALLNVALEDQGLRFSNVYLGELWDVILRTDVAELGDLILLDHSYYCSERNRFPLFVIDRRDPIVVIG